MNKELPELQPYLVRDGDEESVLVTDQHGNIMLGWHKYSVGTLAELRRQRPELLVTPLVTDNQQH